MSTRAADLTPHPRRLLVGLSGGWLLTQLGRQVIPPLLPTVIEQFAISSTAAGFVLTLTWILYAGVHYPGGQFADRLSRRSVLAAGLAVSVVGFVGLGLARSYGVFLLAAACVGVGAGLYFVTMRVVVFDLAPANQGLAIGVNMAAGNVGAIAAAGLAAFVLTPASWQSVFLAVAAGLVVSLSVVDRLLAEPFAVDRVPLELGATTVRVFGSREVRRLAVAYSLVIFVWQGVLGFLPTFLQRTADFSVTLASGAFALVFLVGILFMPVSGRLSDRFSRTGVVLGAILCCTAGLVWIVVATGRVATLGGVVVFAAGLMSFPSAMQAHLFDVLPDTHIGADFGLFKTIYTGSGALGPTYVGLVADTLGYDTAFLTLTVWLLIAAAIVGVFARR